jgi:hypothetical protein
MRCGQALASQRDQALSNDFRGMKKTVEQQ